MAISPPDSKDEHYGSEMSAARGQTRISTTAATGTGRILGFGAAAVGVALLIGFIVAFSVRQYHENAAKREALAMANARPVVDVATVQPTARSYPLELPAQTAGWYESTIFARVDGYVASWRADIGDRVKQGQVLAKIDTPDLDQLLTAARAKAAASAAQEAVAEANVSFARLTNERWRESPKGVVSEQEREDKQAAYDEAVARLAAAKAQTRLDQADVGRYVALEAFKDVTAPYDGIVTARHLDVGDLVSAGSSANNNPLYSIVQSSRIRVYVDVPQKVAGAMSIGLGAEVSSDQFPDRVFHGRIARSAMSIDPATRTQRTEVDVDNPDLALLPGMYVQVTFQLNQRGLGEVPAAAILFRPAGIEVAVVDGSGRIEFHPITIAKDNGDTLVLASGVKAGDRVALNLSSAINSGDMVKAVEDTDVALPPKPHSAPAQLGSIPAQASSSK